MRRMQSQQGAVLIISLVLLLVMTMLGVTSMQSTSLEERMAGNQRHANVAFQAAEAALRGAEDWLDALTSAPTATTDGSNGVWELDAPENVPVAATAGEPWWREWSDTDDTDWNHAGVDEYTRDLAFTSSSNLNAARPRYVIEEISVTQDSLNVGTQGDFGGRNFYQITARGTDVSGRIKVILRSTYATRF